jgi:hypothetical protein
LSGQIDIDPAQFGRRLGDSGSEFFDSDPCLLRLTLGRDPLLEQVRHAPRIDLRCLDGGFRGCELRNYLKALCLEPFNQIRVVIDDSNDRIADLHMAAVTNEPLLDATGYERADFLETVVGVQRGYGSIAIGRLHPGRQNQKRSKRNAGE